MSYVWKSNKPDNDEKMHEKYGKYAKFYEQLLNDLDKTFAPHGRLGSGIP
ncbi:MAG: hypothetical protein QXM37_02045 [Candidatus Bathyarchaeia archaeon]